MYMGPSKLKLIRDPIYKEFHMLHKYILHAFISFSKVGAPTSVTYLYQTPLFRVVSVLVCLPRTDTRKTRLKEIGLRAQIVMTILVSIFNIIGGDLYDNLMSMRIFIYENT